MAICYFLLIKESGMSDKRVSLAVFLNQVFEVEKVRIKMYDDPGDLIFEPYKYRSPLAGNKNRLKDLKTKRLDYYLGDKEYYFYGLHEKDIYNDCTSINNLRNAIIEDIKLKEEKQKNSNKNSLFKGSITC